MNNIKGNIWELVRDNCNYLKAVTLQNTARERVVHARLFELLKRLIIDLQYDITEINL